MNWVVTRLYPTGKVLSVGALGFTKVTGLLQAFQCDLYLVSDNCPSQAILFARHEVSEAVMERARSEGAICIELAFGRAYHTPLFTRGMKVLEGFYQKEIEYNSNSVPVYSCNTTRPYPLHDKNACLAIATEQWIKPVRFRETIEELYKDGTRIFVELGASNSLTAFVESTLKGRDFVAVAANVQGKPALDQFQRLLAQLFINRIDMDLSSLYRCRGITRTEDELKTDMSRKPGLKTVLASALPRLSLDPDSLEELRKEIAAATRHGSANQHTDDKAADSSRLVSHTEAMQIDSAQKGSDVIDAFQTHAGLP